MRRSIFSSATIDRASYDEGLINIIGVSAELAWEMRKGFGQGLFAYRIRTGSQIRVVWTLDSASWVDGLW